MPIYNYKCVDGHVSEWFGKFDSRPEYIPCETEGCEIEAYPSLDGLGIYTPAFDGGTGGGVNMKQKGTKNA